MPLFWITLLRTCVTANLSVNNPTVWNSHEHVASASHYIYIYIYKPNTIAGLYKWLHSWTHSLLTLTQPATRQENTKTSKAYYQKVTRATIQEKQTSQASCEKLGPTCRVILVFWNLDKVNYTMHVLAFSRRDQSQSLCVCQKKRGACCWGLVGTVGPPLHNLATKVCLKA